MFYNLNSVILYLIRYLEINHNEIPTLRLLTKVNELCTNNVTLLMYDRLSLNDLLQVFVRLQVSPRRINYDRCTNIIYPFGILKIY